LLTSDAGSRSGANLGALTVPGRSALVAHTGMRALDARVAAQARQRQGPDPPHDQSRSQTRRMLYQPEHFTYDSLSRTCVCPAGKSRYLKSTALVIRRYRGTHSRGPKRECLPCAPR
jgi:hypothetical protein